PDSVTIDTVAPTATIVVGDTALNIGDDSPVTITFSEAVSGLTTTDFTVANGVLSGLPTSAGGITWTATLTPTASIEDTTNVITLAAASVTDAAGDEHSAPARRSSDLIDTVAPTATIVVGDTALNIGDDSPVTITFSEAVSGLTTTDFTVANGVLSGLPTSAGGITWTATLTPTASIEDTTNVITLAAASVTDAAGDEHSAPARRSSDLIDTVAPTATIVVGDTALNIGDDSPVTITFSEAVSGLTTTDFTRSEERRVGKDRTDGGITWPATLTPTASIEDTTNVITLAAASVPDAAGNENSATATSNNYAIDTVAPTATIVVGDTALNIGDDSPVTITFSEAVSGLTTTDFT